MERQWPIHVIALALAITGLLTPHALLVAAGLLLSGSIALRQPVER
ncbi:hypothetical protein G7043_37030 [Lentzea sp. NEAU-D13]|uniref:Uncharacterized protein n=1 Tax=Lentzea alba TaxID=2714351 RepID=A0A7C9RVI7_9PSEU|nr:hypothetical protein [Lentzea alba]NGY64531.1 hypothetical protein [Lentzea alba]